MASCSTTAPAERYQIQTRWKPGIVDSAIAGTAITTMRVTDAMSDGMVLPIAWNMLEHTKITPDATKVHDDDAQVLLADRDDGRVVREDADERGRGRCCRTRP